MSDMNLNERATSGAVITQTGDDWRMEIPAGTRGTYRLAQLDDYTRLWNDPFGLSFGFGGTAGRLPTLPQAAWFFYGSTENYLSFRDDLPANRFFAGTFRSPSIPSLLLAPSALTLPLLPIRPISRWMRRLTSKIIHQSSVPVQVDVTKWHDYKISWRRDGCSFFMDGQPILETPISPRGPLGLVIWIDNQYAAWGPDGRAGWGVLENPKAWMEIEELEIS
jgi:hypothetical protein